MKLKALFIGGILALGSMSFSNIEEEIKPEAPEAECAGAKLVCTASPGKYLSGSH
ncbi:MAG: hypothetical protein KIG88_02010 [Weeksellaceae bacterium]|nr:hypothetical protein [Weeksellaceae bacterium]